MTKFDLRISNAKAVLPTGVSDMDILVKNGLVSDLVPRGAAAESEEDVDASGLHVFPGVVDAHVHLGPNITYPQGPEDVAPETKSAVAGGVTSLLAYLMTPKPYHDIFPVARDAMAADSLVDFGFHFCVVSREQQEAIPNYAKDLGVSS